MSDSPKFEFFFLNFFLQKLGFFLNLQISVVLTTFSSHNWWLLLKYDMIIFFPGNLSGFQIFSGFSSNLQISVDWMIVYLSNMIWWFCFPEIYPVSGFFPKFSRVSSNFNGLNDSLLIAYDLMIFFPGNVSGFRIFPGFFRIFFKSSDFSIFLQIIDTLFINYDMIIFFSGNYPVSGFLVLLNFLKLLLKFTLLTKKDFKVFKSLVYFIETLGLNGLLLLFTVVA